MKDYLTNRIKEKKEQRLIFMMQWEECRNNIAQLQERFRVLERNIVMTDGELGELHSTLKQVDSLNQDKASDGVKNVI